MPYGQDPDIQIPPQDAPQVTITPTGVTKTAVATPKPVTFGGIGSWMLSNAFVLIIGFGAGWIASRYMRD